MDKDLMSSVGKDDASAKPSLPLPPLLTAAFLLITPHSFSHFPAAAVQLLYLKIYSAIVSSEGMKEEGVRRD